LDELQERDAAGDARPGALERWRLRRRLDRQQRMRQALLLDLGAIVFELHRQGRREPELLQSKAAELRAVDGEVRALADALEQDHGLSALSARGLLATCTACGGFMGRRDRYCPGCGAEAGDSAAPDDAGGKGRNEPEEPPMEPPFGETVEAAALNGSAPDEPEDGEPPPSATAAGSSQAQAFLPLAQRKMRAGRRMARQWLEQRRPDGP
jgi:hypothetical protein